MIKLIHWLARTDWLTTAAALVLLLLVNGRAVESLNARQAPTPIFTWHPKAATATLAPPRPRSPRWRAHGTR